MRFWILLALLAASQAIADPVRYRLDWTIPATRTNGSPLAVTDLAGYELYYAVDGGASGSVAVQGGSTKSAEVTLDHAPRTAPYGVSWSVAAIDRWGLKSPLSVTVATSKSVPLPPALDELRSKLYACQIDNAKLVLARKKAEADLRACVGRE